MMAFMRNAGTLMRVSFLSGEKLKTELHNLKSLAANSWEHHCLKTKWLQKPHREDYLTLHQNKSIFKITPLLMLIFEELLRVDIRDRGRTSNGESSPACFTHIMCSCMTWSNTGLPAWGVLRFPSHFVSLSHKRSSLLSFFVPSPFLLFSTYLLKHMKSGKDKKKKTHKVFETEMCCGYKEWHDDVVSFILYSTPPSSIPTFETISF